MAMAEVYEVATFYHHFDVVKEGETAPPADHGPRLRLDRLRAGRLARAAREAAGAARHGRARAARAVRRPLRDGAGRRRRPESDSARDRGTESSQLVEAPAHVTAPDDQDCDASPPATSTTPRTARRRLRARCRLRRRASSTRADVIAMMEDSGLRGLGGAGFPAGRKWKLVAAEPAPRLMAINIDEGEPGTFKDRYYLERDPHRFLEGALIAAWAVGHRRDLHLPARRVSRLPRDPRTRDRGAPGGSAVSPFRRFICDAAPAPTSAAKSPR